MLDEKLKANKKSMKEPDVNSIKDLDAVEIKKRVNENLERHVNKTMIENDLEKIEEVDDEN